MHSRIHLFPNDRKHYKCSAWEIGTKYSSFSEFSLCTFPPFLYANKKQLFQVG